jgi:hypothetical protein
MAKSGIADTRCLTATQRLAYEAESPVLKVAMPVGAVRT